MAEGNDFAMGYALGQDSGGGNNGGGFGGGWDGIWGIILLAMVLGYGGGGFGFGGFGGGGASGALTRAELYDGFAIQNIDSAVRGVQNGVADSTYAITNAVTSGFHGVDNALCNMGYNIIDANRANTQQIMDFLVNEKLASKDAQIVQLQNQVSQANQTAAFRAAIDASTAEIIRRTGHECPTPAYWVSPPTPVQVPYQSGCGYGC